MTVQSIFGLMAEELLEISYFDAKLFNDQAKEWRDRCKKSAASIRRNRKNMCASRDLQERRILKLQIAYHEKAFGTFWGIYKDAQKTSIKVQDIYVAQVASKAGYRASA